MYVVVYMFIVKEDIFLCIYGLYRVHNRPQQFVILLFSFNPLSFFFIFSICSLSGLILDGPDLFIALS